jgi:hypothetical protein
MPALFFLYAIASFLSPRAGLSFLTLLHSTTHVMGYRLSPRGLVLGNAQSLFLCSVGDADLDFVYAPLVECVRSRYGFRLLLRRFSKWACAEPVRR